MRILLFYKKFYSATAAQFLNKNFMLTIWKISAYSALFFRNFGAFITKNLMQRHCWHLDPGILLLWLLTQELHRLKHRPSSSNKTWKQKKCNGTRLENLSKNCESWGEGRYFLLLQFSEQNHNEQKGATAYAAINITPTHPLPPPPTTCLFQAKQYPACEMDSGTQQFYDGWFLII